MKTLTPVADAFELRQLDHHEKGIVTMSPDAVARISADRDRLAMTPTCNGCDAIGPTDDVMGYKPNYRK